MTGSTDAVSAWVRRSRSRARPGSLAVPALSRCRDARARRPHAGRARPGCGAAGFVDLRCAQDRSGDSPAARHRWQNKTSRDVVTVTEMALDRFPLADRPSKGSQLGTKTITLYVSGADLWE